MGVTLDRTAKLALACHENQSWNTISRKSVSRICLIVAGPFASLKDAFDNFTDILSKIPYTASYVVFGWIPLKNIDGSWRCFGSDYSDEYKFPAHFKSIGRICFCFFIIVVVAPFSLYDPKQCAEVILQRNFWKKSLAEPELNPFKSMLLEGKNQLRKTNPSEKQEASRTLKQEASRTFLDDIREGNFVQEKQTVENKIKKLRDSVPNDFILDDESLNPEELKIFTAFNRRIRISNEDVSAELEKLYLNTVDPQTELFYQKLYWHSVLCNHREGDHVEETATPVKAEKTAKAVPPRPPKSPQSKTDKPSTLIRRSETGEPPILIVRSKTCEPPKIKKLRFRKPSEGLRKVPEHEKKIRLWNPQGNDIAKEEITNTQVFKKAQEIGLSIVDDEGGYNPEWEEDIHR